MMIETPNIIDVEASGFGTQSYPIEVGVVLSNGSRMCRLIQPFDDWQHWDENAEKIHKISRESLFIQGRPAVQVCHELNRFIGRQTVYSDAWVVDNPWMISLFSKAGVTMQFKVSSLEIIMREHQFNVWDKTKKAITRRSGLQRHRASTDACLVQLTYQKSLQRE